MDEGNTYSFTRPSDSLLRDEKSIFVKDVLSVSNRWMTSINWSYSEESSCGVGSSMGGNVDTVEVVGESAIVSLLLDEVTVVEYNEAEADGIEATVSEKAEEDADGLVLTSFGEEQDILNTTITNTMIVRPSFIKCFFIKSPLLRFKKMNDTTGLLSR